MAVAHGSTPSVSTQSPLQRLAAELADCCVDRAFMAQLWAVYYARFLKVLDGQESAVVR